MAQIARIITTLYPFIMWTLAIVCGVLGLLGLLAPSRLRRAVEVFTRPGPVRVLGVFLLLFGTVMFLRAEVTNWALLVKVLGVAVFILGGLGLVIPTVIVIIAEATAQASSLWFRVFGLVLLGLAALFLLGTRPPVEVVEEVIEQVGEGPAPEALHELLGPGPDAPPALPPGP